MENVFFVLKAVLNVAEMENVLLVTTSMLYQMGVVSNVLRIALNVAKMVPFVIHVHLVIPCMMGYVSREQKGV